MNTNNADQCHQLRELHARLTNEVRVLKANIQKTEQEGVETPVEMLNTLKSLQSSLHSVSLKLEECPPAPGEVAASFEQQQTKTTRDINRWFPDEEASNEVQGSSDEFEIVVDEP